MLSYGLSFKLPRLGQSLVGKPQVAQVKRGEDFSDVAERFRVGYYEILEANPGINPDKPPVNTVLVVPTQYILPHNLPQDTIFINLAEMRLYYQPKVENKVYIFPIGIGKEGWNTPTGEMTVIKKTKAPTWHMPLSIFNWRNSTGEKNITRVVPPGPENPLGAYALYLSKSGYLIHGTNLPAGIGRRSTAGCIRLYNDDMELLFNMVKVGTKVKSVNEPYKAGWQGKKLYLEAHMPLFEERLKTGGDIKPALDVVSNAILGRNTKIDWKKVEKIAKEHLAIPRVVN